MPEPKVEYITEFHPNIVRRVPSGGSLPASGSFVGELYWHNNLLWYWDGTRWLSAQKIPHNFNFDPGITIPFNNAGGTSTSVLVAPGPENTLSIYVEKIDFVSNVNTTLDNANKWTVEFFRQNNTPANVSLGTLDLFQLGRVAGTRYHNVLTPNSVFAPNDCLLVFMSATKVGAPGTLGMSSATMWYRLVG